MKLDILNENQSIMLPKLAIFDDFYLVGGTAIALQIGHRQSIDFDLFTNNDFQNSKIIEKLGNIGLSVSNILVDEVNQIQLIADSVKLTFLKFPFALEGVKNSEIGLKMPSLLYLSAMKAHTLGRRGKWKDYVDLYELLHIFSILEISGKTEQIFKNEYNAKLFFTQLGYFEDLDRSESVVFMPNFEKSDDEIRDFLLKKSIEIE